MQETDAQLATYYEIRFRMEIQLEIIVAHTYIILNEILNTNALTSSN